MTEHFVTLFNKNFLPIGLNLYDSLEKNLSDFKLWVLCVDKETELYLKKINRPSLQTISIEEYETDILKSIKKKRSIGEYCWTLTPLAPKKVFDIDKSIKRVTYLDADMFFFKNIDLIFKEFEKSDKSILITEHDFDTDHAYKEKISGKYIVQFIIFKRDDSEKVRKWWEEKCLEKCSENSSNNLIGDQGYLDDWHIRFDKDVHVLKNNDAFRSTWNIKKLNFEKLVAWHFHGLRIINKNLVQLHTEKKLPKNIISEIYQPYLKNLKNNIKQINFKKNQIGNSKNFFYKFLNKINLYLIEKKLINNPRYYIFK